MLKTNTFNAITKNLSKMVADLQALEDANKAKVSGIETQIQNLEGQKQGLKSEADKASAVSKKLEALLSD